MKLEIEDIPTGKITVIEIENVAFGTFIDSPATGEIFGRRDGEWAKVPTNDELLLKDLGDVDNSNIGEGRILRVGSDGITHEYVEQFQDFKLVDLEDVDSTNIAPGKILSVADDGITHEYIDNEIVEGYVPYEGANQDLDMGEFDITTDTLNSRQVISNNVYADKKSNFVDAENWYRFAINPSKVELGTKMPFGVFEIRWSETIEDENNGWIRFSVSGYNQKRQVIKILDYNFHTSSFAFPQAFISSIRTVYSSTNVPMYLEFRKTLTGKNLLVSVRKITGQFWNLQDITTGSVPFEYEAEEFDVAVLNIDNKLKVKTNGNTIIKGALGLNVENPDDTIHLKNGDFFLDDNVWLYGIYSQSSGIDVPYIYAMKEMGIYDPDEIIDLRFSWYGENVTWTSGLDRSDNENFKIGRSFNFDTYDLMIDSVTGEVSIAGDLTVLGNITGNVEGFVPYSGATEDLDLGTNNLITNDVEYSGKVFKDEIKLDVSPSTPGSYKIANMIEKGFVYPQVNGIFELRWGDNDEEGYIRFSVSAKKDDFSIKVLATGYDTKLVTQIVLGIFDGISMSVEGSTRELYINLTGLLPTPNIRLIQGEGWELVPFTYVPSLPEDYIYNPLSVGVGSQLTQDGYFVILDGYFGTDKFTEILNDVEIYGDLYVDGDITANNFSGSSSGTNTGDQDLSGLVPYINAIQNVNLGIYNLSANSVNVSESGDYKQDNITILKTRKGFFNQDNYNNISIGEGAGSSANVDNAVNVGWLSGSANTGYNVTSIGQGSAQENTGNDVNAFGVASGFLNTGSRVTAMGQFAGSQNSGNDCVFFGFEAGRGNTLSNKFIIRQSFVNSNPLLTGDFLSGDINVLGNLTSANLSGTNTGDQDLSVYQLLSEKGQNNGYTPLDAGGKVPIEYLPSTLMNYKGTWNADTNTPTLADGTGDVGDVYICNVAGTQDLGSGPITFDIGDWIIYNGTIWEKSTNSNLVTSVNGQQGIVVLDASDVGAEVPLTFSTGLTRTVDTITTNDGEINHNSLLNTHNLTTDIDHNALTNYVSNEHIDWTNILNEENLYTLGTVNALNISGVNTGDQDLSDYIKQYGIGTAYGTTSIPPTITYNDVNGSVEVTGLQRSRDMFFKPDGTKMYVIDPTFSDGKKIYEYDLTTAWDITTISYVGVFDISAQDNNPSDLYIDSTGTRLYTTTLTKINQYSLSTAWDITSAIYVDSVEISNEGQSFQHAFSFKPDGTKFYTTSFTSDAVYEYNLSTAWDISTATYDGVSFNTSLQMDSPLDIIFKPDGKSMYIVADPKIVYQYALTTPWDLSTAEYVNIKATLPITSIHTYSIFFKGDSDGKKLFALGEKDFIVWEIDLDVPWNLTGVISGDLWLDKSLEDYNYPVWRYWSGTSWILIEKPDVEIDHDGLLNTHNLSTDIDHDGLLNTHNLTTDIDHTQINNIGTNSHSDIDTHISDTSIHNVFGSESAETSSDAEATNATTTYSDKISYTTASLTSGRKYRIGWSYEGKALNAGEQTEFNVEVDGTSISLIEIKDNYYNGTQGGFYYYTPGTTGTKVIKIQHRVKTGTTGTSYIKNARIDIWRVS